VVRYKFVLLFLFCCSFVASTLAVAEDEDRDSEVAERQLAAEEEVAGLIEEAEAREIIEDLERIEYEDILKDPDNPSLNFRYAKQQLADNEILSASGTLERILMVNPEFHAVRLFYAIVLNRLGALQESERELEFLLTLEIPDSLRSQIDENLKKIKRGQRSLKFTLRQSLGYGIDDNKNAAPSSKTTLSSDVASGISGTSRRRRDTHLLIVNGLSASYDPGFQAGHELHGSFTHFLQEQTQVDNLDVQSFRGKLWATYKGRLANVRPKVYLSHLFLSRETFLRTQGFGIAFDRQFGTKWSGSSSFTLERQNYLNFNENTSGAERQGPQAKMDVTANYLLTPTMRVSATAGYTYKNAEERFNASDTLFFNASHYWLLGKGQFLIQSVDIDFEYYNEPEFAVSATTRRDKTLRYRVTYGAPLTFLKVGELLPKPIQDMTVSLTYEFYRASSSITNFTYRNHRIQAILSKVWEF
jgi:hypothetical protein